MNKKILNSTLVIALLGIWGTITYRVISSGQDEELNYEVSTISKTLKKDSLAVETDFIIDGSYRDPFLGKLPRKHQKTVKRTPSKKKPKIKLIPKKTIQWPHINYLGVFQNKKGAIIGMAQINNKDHMVKSGNQINEITFQTIFNDSILVKFKNEKKYIRKANY